MTPERWSLVHDRFHQALAIPVEERDAYLRQTCQGDPELLRHVEHLLRADANPPTLLDASPDELAMLLPEDDLGDGAPGEVGPYRLVREIGRGGMGAVYLAERADGQFARQVALKLVKRGMDTDEIIRRFRYERQILAALEHPHIARLYDGGISPDGRPYLVMEYVDGLPLDHYCDTHRLGIDERLRLFRHVCEAVQYAHSNLVVHRDLKPSNVLVTPDGEVKLLDFGIAKLLSEGASAPSRPMTRTGEHLLTPAYAAPEQLRGTTITTATDVYALGAILYVLTTGHHPYDVSGREDQNLAQVVLTAEPSRPSTAVSRTLKRYTSNTGDVEIAPEAVCRARATNVERLRRRLRGDLDVIMLKALRKEPERRYGSAADLLADLDRHMASLPITARPDTLGYRARTFVRRNTTAVAAALLVLLALVGGLGTALWQARRAAYERDVALQVSAFLEGLFEASSPSLKDAERLDTLRVADVLRLGAQKVRRELQDRPLLQSQMMHVLGSVFNDLALYDDAQPLLEDALTLRRRIHGERHPDVANTLEALGLLYQAQGSYAVAESLQAQVLKTRLAFAGKNDPGVARSHGNLALALQSSNRYDEALPHLQEALRVARLHQTSDPAFYAEIANGLGTLYYMQGDYAAAEPLFRESVESLRQQPNPRHPKLGEALNNLASLLHYSGDLQGAEPLYLEALSIFREAYGEMHPEVSNALQNMATLHDDLDHNVIADSLYRRALAIDRQLFGVQHPNVGLTLRNLALLQLEMGDNAKAEHLLREAQAIFEATLPEDHLYRALTEMALGRTLTQQGRLDEAEPYLQHGASTLAQQLPGDHWLMATVRRELGAYFLARGDYARADTLLRSALPALESKGGDTFQDLLEHLIALYDAWNRPVEAARYRKQLAAL